MMRYRPFESYAFVNGDDLNTFVNPGLFSCGSAAVAKTLVNCPVNSAFRLEVFYNGPGSGSSIYGFQTIHVITGDSFYKRRFRKTADTAGFLFYDWTIFTANPVA